MWVRARVCVCVCVCVCCVCVCVEGVNMESKQLLGLVERHGPKRNLGRVVSERVRFLPGPRH